VAAASTIGTALAAFFALVQAALLVDRLIELLRGLRLALPLAAIDSWSQASGRRT
jgi:hypothetical protein